MREGNVCERNVLLDLCACLFARVFIHSLTLIASGHCLPSRLITPSRSPCVWKYARTFIASTLSQDIGIVGEGEGERSKEWGKTEREWGGGLSFFRLQGRCFSKSAWGYTPAPRLPEAFRLPPNSQPPSVSHGQMMGRFPLLCPALFFLFPFFFFSECTSTQVRMAELPGNSQKPLAFGTICPAAFLLSLIRKEWGWMQSTSSPLDVMRLCKLVLLYSFSSPSFPSAVCSCSCSSFVCFCLFAFPHSLFILFPSFSV